MKKLKVVGALVASALCAVGTQASQVARENGVLAVGFNASETKFVGTPFVRPPTVLGAVVSAGPSNIVTTGGLTDGEFNPAGPDNYFELELTSGRHIGLVLAVLSNSTTAVYLDGALPTTILEDTSFVVRKSWTVGSLFGTNATQVTGKGLKTGTTQASSTTVRVYNPASNAFSVETFFRSSSAQWRLAGSPTTVTNLAGVRLGPQNAFVMQQGSSAGATIVLLTGEYRKTRSLISAGAAASNDRTTFANPSPFATTLATSGLFNTNGESSASNSVDTGTTAGTADEVTKYFGSNNSITNFFRHASGSNWRISGTTTGGDATALGAGEGFIFKRQPAGEAFVAFDPVFNE